jgi:hypothetical protein
VPSGAQVIHDGKILGVTPLDAQLERKTCASRLTFKKPGYGVKTVDLARTVTTMAFFNIGFITTTFGATSWGIDAATGKLFEYSPKAYVVELTKGSQSSLPSDGSLEYVLAHFGSFKQSLAQGDSSRLKDVCRLRKMSSDSCSIFIEHAQAAKLSLIAQNSPVSFYRLLF